LQAKWLDPVILSRLETVLTGATFEEMLPAISGGYQRMDNPKEGPWLTGVRPSLAAALAGAVENDVPRIAAEWAKAEEMAGWSAQDVQWLVAELSRLARIGQATSREMFVWMCM
jgi:hypothetical protein